ncbi:hypothetical protein [Staphylococcus equorum]|uniref:Uncharacterized protein n=1 Tax=Staphylococcus equorum TaxID=246432 RepID=A0AAP7LV40_9STAP|nr:hypothetical protein [Staphylococcus equorum]OEK58970.1 hypothetical protein ASS94_01190 [Staphylococcus equorum]
MVKVFEVSSGNKISDDIESVGTYASLIQAETSVKRHIQTYANKKVNYNDISKKLIRDNTAILMEYERVYCIIKEYELDKTT